MNGGFSRDPKIAAGGVKRARGLRSEMTRAETLLWEQLRGCEVRIRRQAPIGRYVADFACLPARIIVEIDGEWHNTTDRVLRDQGRDAWLKSEGYRVMRFSNDETLRDPRSVAKQVLDAIERTLPPRGGKGRDGGVAEWFGRLAPEAELPHPPHLQGHESTPTRPSPLAGEGS